MEAGAEVADGLEQHGLAAEGEAVGAEHGDDGDKPLTSKYRGVCWNKKNRRWQAAINSSGKYIYLGSFLEEEEAARMFDRAAVRLRGNRAKLNFAISDYTDASGELLNDERVNGIIAKAEGAGPAPGAKGGRAANGDQAHPSGGGITLQPALGGGGTRSAAGSGGGRAAAGPAGTLGPLSQPPDGGFTIPAHNFRGRAITPLDVPLPPGCQLDGHVPGEADAFGVLYQNPDGHLGATIWDGFASQDLGVYDTDRDARTACTSALRIVMQYKNQSALLLQGVAETMLSGNAAADADVEGAGANGGLTIASNPPRVQAPPRRPSGLKGFNLVQEPVSLDALTALHSASHMDGSSLGPMTVLSAAPTLAQGFGGSAGLASGTAGATLKPGGGNGGSSGGYADLFSFITTSYKGGPSKSLGLAGVGARGEEGGGMAPGAPGGTDIAGLLAQLNASQAGSGMGGMTGDVLQALPSLPLMLGRVPGGTGVGVAAGLPPDSLQLLAAALPGGVALSRCDSDDGSGAGISGSGNGEPSLKRQRMSTGATLAAVALPLPVAGATLGVGGVGADFSQMKSLANLSVQDVMRHLNASSGG